MKTTFMLAALCALAQVGYAQTAIKAGTVQLGGGINYSQQSGEGTYNYYSAGNPYSTIQYTKTKNLSLNPSVGYLLADNLALGLGLAYSSYKMSFDYASNPYNTLMASEQVQNQISVGPFLQYYHMLTEQFGLAGTLGAGFSHNSLRYSDDTRYYGNGLYAGLTPSVVFFPIPKFAVSTSVGGLTYAYSTSKSDNNLNASEGKGSSFGANFGFNYFTLVGTYYFGR